MNEQYEGFKKLVSNPSLLDGINGGSTNDSDYPAAPGGLRAYWDTKCVYHGWKLQKNYYFGHYRILDEYNVKRARYMEGEIVAALETLASSYAF